MSGRISHIVIRAFLIMLLSVTAAAVAVAVEPADRHEAPSAVVRAYLQAVREGNYDQTYNYLSSKRRNGMSRKDWVEQFRRQAVKLRSKVLMRVNPAFVRGEEATVVTSFRLKTPKGTKVSRETYDLVREEGRWRIDGSRVFDAPAEK
ncbi:MAG: DUF4878 domain-containing protein [candidate division NC10 bacterium]|nr:DUF4878 domain-containing protein [candidate division NC10 bacterium]MCH7897661.1 DUF4878 domain-containing protein [candidate division NC10 bacterium]